MQILDDVQVGEAEATDAQLVDATNLDRPQQINLGISFVQINTFKRLFLPLAKELPDTVMQDEEEVHIPEEDRLAEICRSGSLSFSIELPDGRWVQTTSVPLADENPDEPIPEEIDLSGIRVQGEDKASPLFFVYPLNSQADTAGKTGTKPGEKSATTKTAPGGDLVVLRDWLRSGMKVKAFWQKNPPPSEPVDEGEEPPPPPPFGPPRNIAGCVVPLNSILRPSVCTLPEEARQEKSLPVPPAPINIGPSTVSLPPYSFWIEPDVQVPLCDLATKNVSEDSAVFKIGVSLYAKEPPPEAEEE